MQHSPLPTARVVQTHSCTLFVLGLVLAAMSATLVAQPISSPVEFKPQPFDVVDYDATITAPTGTTTALEGHVAISVTWLQPGTWSFPIMARGISIREVRLDSAIVPFVAAGNKTSDTAHIRIGPITIGTPDSTTIIHVWYGGVGTTEDGMVGGSGWGGIHAEDSIVYALGVGFANNYVSTTQHWLPCYDHPSDKATVRLRVTVPKPLVVASVGKLVSTDSTDSSIVYTWREEYPVATYLLTFAVGNFTRLTNGNSTPHEYYTLQRDKQVSEKNYALVPQMTNLFASLFGAYPFYKVGYVNTPKGSMEHQGMICQSLTALHSEDTVAVTAAHELSHQWFGNHVTPIDFRYVWLTESFATFSELLWLEHLFGSERYLSEFVSRFTRYSRTIGPRESHCALENFPRATVSNYPESIYQKGALVLAMLRWHVNNDSAFFAGLRQYQRTYSYANATTQNFIDAFEQGSTVAVATFIQQWVQQPGYALLAITRQSGSNTVVFQQVQQQNNPTWPLYTLMPLAVRYVNDEGVDVDTVLKSWSPTGAVELQAKRIISVNEGPNARCMALVVRNTSIVTDVDIEHAVTVFPTEVAGHVNVRVEGLAPYTLEVYNPQGHLCVAKADCTETTVVSTNGLANGWYTMRVRLHGTSTAIPFVIRN
jgi:aminopeptidase N